MARAAVKEAKAVALEKRQQRQLEGAVALASKQEASAASPASPDLLPSPPLPSNTLIAADGIKLAREGSKARKGRCGRCVGCRRGDCGKCFYCKNKIKFGGNGTLKQARHALTLQKAAATVAGLHRVFACIIDDVDNCAALTLRQ